jgi:hypothetical protein
MKLSGSVRAVALLEATKGTLVFLAGFGALSLLHHDVQRIAGELIGHLHLNPAKRYPSIFLEAAGHLTVTVHDLTACPAGWRGSRLNGGEHTAAADHPAPDARERRDKKIAKMLRKDLTRFFVRIAGFGVSPTHPLWHRLHRPQAASEAQVQGLRTPPCGSDRTPRRSPLKSKKAAQK